jgi:hypothetical protein
MDFTDVYERLMEKSAPDDSDDLGCRIWLGTCDQFGFGKMRENGTIKPVHRIMWALHHDGEYPPLGFLVYHTCGKRNCITAEHLYILPSEMQPQPRKLEKGQVAPYGMGSQRLPHIEG